jgi:hypothetical protein
LNADDSGQKQAEENQNAQNNKSKKVVPHGEPDEAAEASVVHWPGDSGHPR